ncbi:ABC transporter permease [Aureibacillus halotolerans]|uniref:Peptide/nickel transport system permease protein n=1 Tax=Aureibacillus halotolerans TaxID=1508390 RepID=A0A4R6TXM5_9BACI|nr:ABC transporter permease [Aureibacillus halotolerans]TDQ38301.1 peptide/nickel transport system permease protein [Aureibacillus halotolerans]
MASFLLQRFWQSILLVFIVSILTFFLINLAPGGPSSMMRMDATEEERQAISAQLGLDKPVIVRYGEWLGNAVRGDLGDSLSSGQPVIQRIAERFPHTLQLTILTLIVSVVIGMILGIIAAMKRNRASDYMINFIAVIGLSVPSFWLAIMLILLFSVTLQWLPSSGVPPEGVSLWEQIKYLILPVIILSTSTLPTIVRFMRSSMLEVISQNYVRTARAKGVKESVVIYWHAMRNALIPVVSIVGVLVPRLLGGAVIVESVFGWPGMGRLIVEAANSRDYTLVMGVTIVVTLLVVLTNFIVDIVYSKIDPRVKNF